MEVKEYSLCIVSDTYFSDFPSERWMWNKGENRPHYYAFLDKSGMMWLIPLSSKVEKYEAKILQEESRRGKGSCLFYHIGKAAGRRQAFIISGMMPVSEQYLVRLYTIDQIPVQVQNTKLNRELRSKALRYLHLLELHTLKDINNVLEIRQKLSDSSGR